MSDVGAAAAQRYRQELRSKAARMGGGSDARSVDASDFTPGERLDAEAKTGMRPVSRQARRDGGTVSGAHAAATPGRAARKSGGGFGESFANRDMKEANEDRAGIKHDMGLKGGGRAHHAEGGSVYKPDIESGVPALRNLKRSTASGTVETRVARQAGGPLSTPLAAGMGGQGRFDFNYPTAHSPAQALGLKDGGRAKAHERYGHAPSCTCSSCRSHKAAGGRATYGRSPEDVEFDNDARETLGEGRPGYNEDAVNKSIASSNRSGRKIGSREAKMIHGLLKGRAEGGEVASGALKQHRVEHQAMGIKGRAAGGKAPEYFPGSKVRVPSDEEQDRWEAQRAARRAARQQEGGAAKTPRARGGRSGKGKTNINIIIGSGAHQQPAAAPPPPGMNPQLAIRPPVPPMPPPGMPPPGAGPPMGAPMGAGPPPGMPPPGLMPPRARGGRAPKIEAGAGSGLGRLEKIKAYGKRSYEVEK